MNPNVKVLYAAVSENRVVAIESNLTQFCMLLKKIEPEANNYEYYYREFKKSDIVKIVTKSDKVYILQKVL